MTAKKSAPRVAEKTAARVKPGTSKDAAASRKRLFIEAYIANGGNATEAAKKAGYSQKTAYSQGSRLLKDVEVVAAVGQRQEKLAAKFELTTEAVLRNLAQTIFFDPRKLYDENGRLKDVHELDDDTAMALAGVEVKEEFSFEDGKRVHDGYTKKLKWLDKNTAREQAMKHLGQYREDNTQRNPLADIPRDALKAIVERLQGHAGNV